MKNLIETIVDTKRNLNSKDYRLLLKLAMLTIFVSLIEIIGISAVIPFLTLSLDPDLIVNNYYYSKVYDFFSFDSQMSFIAILGFFLMAFYLLRGALNIFFNYQIAKFHYGKNKELSVELFEKYLDMEYLEYTKQNSTHLIKTIIIEVENFSSLLEALILIFSELLIFSIIVFFFFFVNFETTLILFLFLLSMGYIIGKGVFPVIKKQGRLRSKSQKNFFEIVKRSLSNFKLLKLDVNKGDAVSMFSEHCKEFARANIVSSTLNAVPRHIMEALVFTIVIGLTIIIF